LNNVNLRYVYRFNHTSYFVSYIHDKELHIRMWQKMLQDSKRGSGTLWLRSASVYVLGVWDVAYKK